MYNLDGLVEVFINAFLSAKLALILHFIALIVLSLKRLHVLQLLVISSLFN